MMDYKTIGALGDSITNGFWDEDALGWFGRLSKKIANNFPYKFSFNNMSKGGDTTCDIYHRCSYEAFSRSLDIILINIGINDLVRTPNPDSPTYMSESFRKKYWDRLLDLLCKTNAKILVMDILPIIEESRASGEKYNFNSDVEEYNKFIESICKKKNIPFFGRYKNWSKKNLKEFYVDTVHPSGVAHQILANEIYDELIKIGYIGNKK